MATELARPAASARAQPPPVGPRLARVPWLRHWLRRAAVLLVAGLSLAGSILPVPVAGGDPLPGFGTALGRADPARLDRPLRSAEVVLAAAGEAGPLPAAVQGTDGSGSGGANPAARNPSRYVDPGRFARPVGPVVLRDGPPGEPPIPAPLHALLADPYQFLRPLRANPPVTVRGIYVTGWVAGLPQRFEALRQLVLRTELNAMVIDVKDDTGYLTYRSKLEAVKALGADSGRIPDLPALVARLNRDGIYPIARLVLFKDPVLARLRPDLAVQSSGGGIWRDRKGLAWADPHQKAVWDYNLAIAREVAAMGFREIQFDYVRFPTDGDRSTIVYPGADGRSRGEVIREFLEYAAGALRPSGVYVSADIFGLVTTAEDDMGIGQVLEEMAPAVDYLSPMVYPSHYAPYSYGIPDPDARPYETVYQSMATAARRLGDQAPKLRPWLQDFTLRHRYGAAEVRAQIQAVYDAGLTEWILWNPTNVYSEGALRAAADAGGAGAEAGAAAPDDSAPRASPEGSGG